MRSNDVQGFRTYVTDTWIKDCKASDGNAGAFLFSRIVGDRAEVITLSFWVSQEALNRFHAGDVMAPHYYPEDARYIIEGDAQVVHYDAD